MGNTTDVSPEIGGRTTKYANVRCDMIFDNVGRAPSDPLYLLITWRTSGQHVELPDGVTERHQIYNQSSLQKHTTNTVRISRLN